VSTNYINVDNLATLLQKLWLGQLLNNQHTQYLLSLMQDTNDDTLIPPAVPDDAVVYHKYGELEDDVNDIAIIKTGGHVYALAIMTNGNGTWAYDTRTQLFHDLVETSFAS
jgi:beta-lactamase class A